MSCNISLKRRVLTSRRNGWMSPRSGRRRNAVLKSSRLSISVARLTTKWSRRARGLACAIMSQRRAIVRHRGRASEHHLRRCHTRMTPAIPASSTFCPPMERASESGSVAGLPIVLVHGSLRDHTIFDPLIAQLQSDMTT